MNEKYKRLFWLIGLLNMLCMHVPGYSDGAETQWEASQSSKSATLTTQIPQPLQWAETPSTAQWAENQITDAQPAQDFNSANMYSGEANAYTDAQPGQDYNSAGMYSGEANAYPEYGSEYYFEDYGNNYPSFLGYLTGARLEAGYNFGKFIGIRHSYAEFGVFLPVHLSDYMCFESDVTTFADVRGYHFTNAKSRWGASAGVGFRSWRDEGILGANVYYDFLESRHRRCNNRGFNRIGFGLEWLGPCFDIRANAYFPIGKRSLSRKFIFDDYIGDFIVIAKDTQFVVGEGFDAELGIPLIDGCDFRVYGAAGPYYYQASHCHHYWGGQARLEFNWRSYLSLQVRTSYDGTNHSHTQGRVILSVPFDVFCGCEYFEDYCNQLLYQPVIRTGVIFTDHCCDYKKNW